MQRNTGSTKFWSSARYSGDISSWSWTQGSNTAKAYGFAYDGAHRLTAGQYFNNGTSTNALSEKAIGYDLAGNITTLTRYDNADTGTTPPRGPSAIAPIRARTPPALVKTLFK